MRGHDGCDVCARYTHLVDALALAHPHPAGLFVLAVGLSRVYLGVHFPQISWLGGARRWRVTVFTKLYLANFYNPG